MTVRLPLKQQSRVKITESGPHNDIYVVMTRIELQIRIKALRTELEDRHKYGTIKMASDDGTPISTEKLQNEMYSLIYRLSTFE